MNSGGTGNIKTNIEVMTNGVVISITASPAKYIQPVAALSVLFVVIPLYVILALAGCIGQRPAWLALCFNFWWFQPPVS